MNINYIRTGDTVISTRCTMTKSRLILQNCISY